MTVEKTQILSADDLVSAGATDREPKFEGDRIVFFCPKGHKITVDRGLAGKPGTCNGYKNEGCGSRFVVPSPAGVEWPTAVSDQTPAVTGAPAPAGGAATAAAAPAAVTPVAESPDANQIAEPVTAGAAQDADAGGALGVAWSLDIERIDHPAARLVARLWLERAHGGVVEVHLAGGSVIMPEWYDPRWSTGDHAVFAALAADGTLTLTAVAWSQVQKVVVRQVQGTPDGMFEG